MDPHPITLEGRHVRLEPLDLERHWDGLVAIATDISLWRHTTAKIRTQGDLRRYLETALEEQARGRAVPFAIVHVPSGRVAGCTRFANIFSPTPKR